MAPDTVLAFCNLEEECDTLVGIDGTPWHSHGVVQFMTGASTYVECDEIDILVGLGSGELRLGYTLWMGADRPSPDYSETKFMLLLSSHLETGHYFNPHAQRIIEAKERGAPGGGRHAPQQHGEPRAPVDRALAGDGGSGSPEQLPGNLVAGRLEVGGHVAEDARKRADPQGSVSWNGDVVLATLSRGQAHVAAGLARAW